MTVKKLFAIIISIVLFMIFPLTANAESPALLSDLDVTNGFMIQFDKDTYTYTVELDEGETTPDVIVVPSSDDCSVNIEGDTEPIPPDSEQTVTVSANDTQGNFATYTLKVYAQAERGGLSFLRCLNGTMSPQYRETAENFYIILPNECDSAELDIRTWDENAEVKVTGNENLEPGKRKKATITITDTNGKISNYSLYIYRQKMIESNINRSYMLSDIQINSGAVPIEFEQTRGYYRIEVPNSVSKLDISAAAADRENIFEISGSDIVTDDGNTIVTVVVRDPDNTSEEKSIYVLEFYRNTFTKTPKYTDFQLICTAVAAVLLTLIIVLLVYLIVNKKRKTEQPNISGSKIKLEKETEKNLAAAQKKNDV